VAPIPWSYELESLTIIKGLSQLLASVRDIGAKILLVVVDLHE